ncbi:unnamed protein product [Cuscuta campestris]|uniref:DUF4378 domain-containing protein n=1 Tax=Cuscuta campestris TaxID=132261 RepID=A0A484NFV5_9ASTE|nr:unnamed protein product [Cuscuta campestris]
MKNQLTHDEDEIGMTRRRRIPSKGQNGQSAVARLMGVDMSPFLLDSMPTSRQNKKKKKKSEKPTPRREHPQEEELEKFKKEFEAWQTEKQNAFCLNNVSSKIVVVRPDFDDIEAAMCGSQASSPRLSEERGGHSMEDFLEEVNKRLRREWRETQCRGRGIETPYSEKSPYEVETKLSPRSLIRSLSAPISRTSLGYLLLEEAKRKRGANDRVALSALDQNKRKEKFSLKEKVSSFKAKLFSKKLQPLEGSHGSCGTKHILNDSTTMNLNERHENFTEVPPSPASVCSSVTEELGWRPGGDYSHISSPASTPDIHPLVESDMPRIFREISSNIRELRRQLNQLETGEAMTDEQPRPPLEEEMMMEIHDNAKAYIRDLLIASGLYDDKYPSRWDPFGKAISDHVFEGVENAYRQKKAEGNEEERLNHKMLCDLLNEAVPNILQAPLTLSRFMEDVITMSRPPRGRKLLDCVWEMTRAYIYPGADLSYCSLEGMVAHDLKSTPWLVVSEEDGNAIGKDVESQITGDLIQEILEDMKPLS